MLMQMRINNFLTKNSLGEGVGNLSEKNEIIKGTMQLKLNPQKYFWF